MRILRKTMYPPTKEVGPPASMVIRECDLKEGVTIETAASDSDGPHDLFIFNDIFEIAGEPDIVHASLEAAKRQQENDEDEWNMAILFYWDGLHLKMVVNGGVLAGKEPAPLSKDQIEYTFKCLFKHDNYKNQTLVTFSNDGYMVTGKAGIVSSIKQA